MKPAQLLLLLLLALPACQPLGPNTIARDRFEYSASISDSWKRQTLLNIVKLRYLDPPIFVDVGQIVSGYSLETSGNIFGQLSPQWSGNQFGGAGASATFTDRPTITYSPLTGDKFIKSLMTPLPPESVFFMIQAGWPADSILLSTVSSLNGLKNQQVSLGGTLPPAPEFLQALALMRKIQLAGDASFRVVQDAQKNQTALFVIHRDESAQTTADAAELRRLLRLDPQATEFKLVLGAVPASATEVAVTTRSIIQLMSAMAVEVDVPPQDIAQHRTPPGWESIPDPQKSARLLEVHCGSKAPDDAYVAVHYRAHWFWIDDQDLKSKRTLAVMMMLFTLADAGNNAPPPLVTIPAR